MVEPIVLSVTAVIALVISDLRGFRPGRLVAKPLAALAFLWLAVALGALEGNYGQWLFAGLVLCAFGDLFLMGESDALFKAGLFSFLSGHLLYCVAFAGLDTDWTLGLIAAVPAAALLGYLLRWLSPHLPADMRIPVYLYFLVIGSMLVFASAALNSSTGTLIVAGAWGFALSDIAVARRVFVNPTPLNGLWGTPLYFGSQMLLAASVAGY